MLIGLDFESFRPPSKALRFGKGIQLKERAGLLISCERGGGSILIVHLFGSLYMRLAADMR